MNRNLTTTLLLTLLVLGGCGYSSEEECRLKEMQKCDSKSCENEARSYCDSEFPGETTRFIYVKKSSPENWVTVTVDNGRVYLKERISRYAWANVCLKKEWSLGEGRCHKIWLNKQSPNGTYVTERLSEKDWFHEYINEAGDGLKETTVVNVSVQESVGFFRYYFGWTIYILYLFGLLIFLFWIGAIGTAVINWFSDEEVEIPEREELESMTKAEIKEWADAFGFNVPLRLDKKDMIDRFVEETDAYVESLEE